MFRFVAKLPKNYALCRTCQLGTYLNSNLGQRREKSTSQQPCLPQQKPPKRGNPIKFTIGALALVGIATVGYAKYDPEFREWLAKNVPGSDEFLAYIFQEKRSIYDATTEWFSHSIDSASKAVGLSPPSTLKIPPKKAIEDKGLEYTPPRPVFPSLVEKEKEEKFNEIRVVNEPPKDEIKVVQEKPKKPEETLSATHPKSLSDLEAQINDAAAAAILAYKKAYVSLTEYNDEIAIIVENSVDKLDQNVWNSLKKKTDAKNEMLIAADKSAQEAIQKLNRLERLLADPSFDGPEGAREQAIRNMSRTMDDMKKAKKCVDDEREMADVTEKYWKKVEIARLHFIEELEILFPDVNIGQKKLSLSQSDIDLFILHAFANVLFYQKELCRVQTVGQSRLRHALDQAAKGDPNFDVVEIHIQEEIEKEKKNLELEYQKRCLKLRQESERDLRHRLKCQAEAHQDHLNDVLITREQELEREFNRKLDEELAKEQMKYKMQLAGMVGRMKGMRNAIKERIEADKIAKQSQVLWSACQALHRAVRTSSPGVPWCEQVKPLQKEIAAIKDAASDSDELVKVVLDGIPPEALERGVFPEDAIRERFLKVEQIARRVALVPEEGGRLPLFLLSFLQSMLLIKAANPIPQAELADEPVDFNKLNTYDILQRARYWLDRGNYAQTLRYMNLLKGASRCVASQWMHETRLLLETQQAAETLMAHAVAGGLTHM